MTISNNINNYQIDNSASNILEKVAAGLEINKASDNPSALAIADQLRLQSNSISQSIENVNSGIALANIADSGLTQQKTILENIQSEILKANNGTLNEVDRNNIANQIDRYIDQFNSIADQTNYNGKNLLTSTGDETLDDLSISMEDSLVELSSVDTKSITNSLSSFLEQFATDSDTRDNMLNALNDSISQLNSYQSDFASASNQLESTINNYLSAQTNISNGESQIRDLNYSSILETFSKADIQAQLGSFIQSQANASSARIMQLLS